MSTTASNWESLVQKTLKPNTPKEGFSLKSYMFVVLNILLFLLFVLLVVEQVVPGGAPEAMEFVGDISLKFVDNCGESLWLTMKGIELLSEAALDFSVSAWQNVPTTSALVRSFHDGSEAVFVFGAGAMNEMVSASNATMQCALDCAKTVTSDAYCVVDCANTAASGVVAFTNTTVNGVLGVATSAVDGALSWAVGTADVVMPNASFTTATTRIVVNGTKF